MLLASRVHVWSATPTKTSVGRSPRWITCSHGRGWPRSGSSPWLLLDLHGCPGDQGLRWVDDDRVCRLESRHHLDSIAVIAADRHRDQLRLAMPHNTDL